MPVNIFEGFSLSSVMILDGATSAEDAANTVGPRQSLRMSATSTTRVTMQCCHPGTG
jgi:hypothetical protein